MGRKKALWYILVFGLTCAGVLAAALAYGLGISETIRAVVSAGAAAGTVLFLWEDHAGRGALWFDAAAHPRRFLVAWLGCLAITLLLPLVVMDAWPFAALYVVLALLSCPLVGAFAGTALLMLAVLLQEAQTPEHFVYIFSGFIALALFSHLDAEMNAYLPLFLALLMQTALLVCYRVMFADEAFTPAALVAPGVNGVVSFSLLIVALNAFSFYVVRRDAERYMEINDPGFALMLRLREKSETEYQRAIHTDYLTQRVASALSMDRRAIRTMTYYHRAAVLLEDKGREQILALYREYHFPEEAVARLDAMIAREGGTVSAEATVISLCGTLIASLQYMFRRNPKMEVDYGMLVDKIIKRKEADGELAGSELSLRGLQVTRELLKKEALYYDFLR